MEKLPHDIRSTADLARHLGLSRWTVSRALNGRPDVREETRRRVVDTARQLGFRPNAMARGLRGGSSGLIGVCFQEIDSPILAVKVGALQRALRADGLGAMLELSSGDVDLEREIISHYLRIKAGAIILIGSLLRADDPVVAAVTAAGVPVVAVDPAHPLPFATITLDREAGMGELLRHLYALGHRRFALIGLRSDPIYGTSRLRGLEKEAAHLDLPFAESFSFYEDLSATSWSYEYGSAQAELVAQVTSPQPTAIICLNDSMAIGAIRTLHRLRKRVPQDVSVSGFDNLDISQWIEPSLTTIGQRPETVMQHAAETLRQLHAERSHAIPLRRVTPELVVRDSTGAAV